MKRVLMVTCLLALGAGAAEAKKAVTDRELMRRQAEHLCYDDVQKLCNTAIPDEEKIKACMNENHAKLSPACAKIYDDGLGD